MKTNKSLFYKKSILIRETEQTLLDLFSKGKLNGTVHTCIGQEYNGAILHFLAKKRDTVFSNHRGHGHYIGKTDDVEGLLLEVMGDKKGIVGGIGGSQHLYNEQGFFSNGILSGMSPVAAGYSFSIQNTNNIVIYFIGDGGLSEGIFYESLNLISKFNLPILIINEFNNYSQSTPSSQHFFGNIKKRIEGFGIEYHKTNIWNVDKYLNDFETVFENIRTNRKPIFLHVDCYRLKPHSKGDDNRDLKEILNYKKIDPIEVFKLNQPDFYDEYFNEAQSRIQKCLKENKVVFNKNEKTINFDIAYKKTEWEKLEFFSDIRINEDIYAIFKKHLEINKDIFIFGEDIEFPYGGAFSVTKDLSALFKNNVFNMPDSEAAIIGFGNGLSLAGKLPICEIMFGDFLSLIFDQWLNHAAKFSKMYNNNISNPIIIRTPMGGKRGYGPTHSQSIEKHFVGVPNTEVISLNFRYNVGMLYDNLIQNISKPTLVIENKIDYSKKNIMYKNNHNYSYYYNINKQPDLKLTNNQNNIEFTIVCYGGTLFDCEKILENLIDKEEIFSELIVLQQIYPLNINSIVESLKETKRLIIIEDSVSFNSIGSEIISQLNLLDIDFKLLKINSKEDIIPSSKILESNHFPSVELIIDRIKKFYLNL